MKPYVKPELNFESYELSQHIAACRWDWVNSTDKSACYAEYDFDVYGTGSGSMVHLFIDLPNCNVTENAAMDYCYTTGTNQNVKLFQS
jgi:hypothetical protein